MRYNITYKVQLQINWSGHENPVVTHSASWAGWAWLGHLAWTTACQCVTAYSQSVRSTKPTNKEGVMVADDDFKQHSDTQIAAKRQRDFDDLQLELSGQDTGRMQRFGAGNTNKRMAERKKDEQFSKQLTALQRLLENDPVYAALHSEVMDLLAKAETAADAALDQAREDLQSAEAGLQDIQEGANQLPDGTRIYKDADGQVWTEDGRLVPKEDLGGVVWKDGAASYEDYLRQKQTIEDAKARIHDIEDYLYKVLGPARGRLTDPDNPPSKDDLDRIKDDILSKAPKNLALEDNDVAYDDLNSPTANSELKMPKI